MHVMITFNFANVLFLLHNVTRLGYLPTGIFDLENTLGLVKLFARNQKGLGDDLDY